MRGNVRKIQPKHREKLRLILSRLDAAGSAEDMRAPSLRLHGLKGDLAGNYAVVVSGNWRVIFRFDGADAVDVDYLDYH